MMRRTRGTTVKVQLLLYKTRLRYQVSVRHAKPSRVDPGKGKDDGALQSLPESKPTVEEQTRCSSNDPLANSTPPRSTQRCARSKTTTASHSMTSTATW